MPRCFYYAIRLQDQTPQILVSMIAQASQLNAANTNLLPDKRQMCDTHQQNLEWHSPSGEITQAAIALLGHATTAASLTRRYALQFQSEVLNRLPQTGWTLRADEIRYWVAQQRRREHRLQKQTCIDEFKSHPNYAKTLQSRDR